VHPRRRRDHLLCPHRAALHARPPAPREPLPVRYDTGRWITEFLGTWPPGTLATMATTTASPTVPGFGSTNPPAARSGP